MLAVSQATYASFEQSERAALVARIDRWLCSQAADYAATDGEERCSQLYPMIDLALEDGMETEREVGFFALGCWSLGPDWKRILTSGQTGNWLADPTFNTGSKLLHIDDLVTAGAAR
ncbi:MAG: hypothetical protein V2I43_03210 [Parvularcula sp.]|jgi:hypothetical protein|nr:hypothetical protein [Parvularcula sp.]